MCRGIRNCNPGNIRRSKTKYLGEITPSCDAAFKQFVTMAWGYRAMFVLLDSYCRNGYRTIRQMIARYAPPIENHTENYIRCVAEWSGGQRCCRTSRRAGRSTCNTNLNPSCPAESPTCL